ncbi:Hypothetical predicted protein [Marmota monax]|nr:transmembrane protein 258 [Marmota monax]VTJ57438.1 Hypothetical predicted protein [Marmota monax]
MPRARGHRLFRPSRAPAPADVFFRWQSGGLPCAGQNGARGHEQIHQPSKSSCLPPSDCGASGYWHVLHRLVLRLRGYLHQVHTGYLQRAPHLLGGLTLYGLWSPLPPSLGRHLRVSSQG